MHRVRGIGIQRKQVPRPRERVRRRLVPGQEQRHRLITQLLVGHPAAVAFVVHCHEQHRQQIAAILPRFPPLVDDAVDRLVQPLQRSPKTHRLRQRQLPQKVRDRIHQRRKKIDQRRQRSADLIRLLLHLGIEQRLGDDGKREPHHLVMDIEHLVIGPCEF